MEVLSIVARLAGQSPVDADLDVSRAALADAVAVERWAAAQRLAWHAHVEALAQACPSILPEQVNADATRRSMRAALDDSDRAATLAVSAPMRAAFEAGGLTVEQLDVLRLEARPLDTAQRVRLFADASLHAVAPSASPEQFRRLVRHRIRQLLADDGIERLQQQRRDVALRWWVEGGSGMIRFGGQLDPETGTRFLNRIRLKVEELFHDQLPDTCPTDPQLRQAHLAGLALVALTEAKHGHPGVAEVIVVIDADTVDTGPHDHSVVRHQHDIELPVSSIRRMLCTETITPVTVREGVVLDVGRTRRLATRAQRRALRVMHPTCAIPGCDVRYDHCQPHHIAWWRHGGTTDLANLVMLCSHHHHRVHDHGWQLHLEATTRELTVTLPDGTTMSHAPPTARAG